MGDRVGNQIMQVFVEDHVSPFMNAIGDMHLKVGRVKDACPPLPENSVTIVQGIGVGGPYIKMLPTADLMGWMSKVMELAEVGLIPAEGPLRREAVASRDGSVGYMEMPALTVAAGQGAVRGTAYRPQPSGGDVQR